MNENSQPRITIEVSASGLVIRVENISLSDTDQFDNAYRTARRLLRRIPHLDQTIEVELVIEEGRLATNHLWTQVDDEFSLAAIPTEPQERIALSLLRVYPQCMRETDIVREISVQQRTANRHLRGERESTREFFSVCEEGYTLTEGGIRWVLNEVIPNLNLER
jgi:hypothetical protein